MEHKTTRATNRENDKKRVKRNKICYLFRRFVKNLCNFVIPLDGKHILYIDETLIIFLFFARCYIIFDTRRILFFLVPFTFYLIENSPIFSGINVGIIRPREKKFDHDLNSSIVRTVIYPSSSRFYLTDQSILFPPYFSQVAFALVSTLGSFCSK